MSSRTSIPRRYGRNGQLEKIDELMCLQLAPAKKANEKWLVSPLAGEWIPSDKIEEHIRYV